MARTVEVFVTRIACLDKRFDDAINERMLRPSILDGKRPIGAMKLTGTSLIGFGLDEVRQEFLVGPPRRALGRPFVIVRAITTNINHSIHGGTAAKNLAARQVNTSPEKRGFRLRRIVPIMLQFEQLREGNRSVNFGCIIHRTGFDQRNLDGRILT